MLATTWTPTEIHWGDLAHHEVMAIFEGRLKTRTVALCVWYLAQATDATPYEIETVARRDPDIEPRPDGTRITAYAVKQARKILGLAPAQDASPARSSRSRRRKGKRAITRAVQRHDPDAADELLESAGIIDDYLNLGAELASVQAAFAKAHQVLMALSREHALTLAEIAPNAAQVLAREGLLKPPGAGGPQAF